MSWYPYIDFDEDTNAIYLYLGDREYPLAYSDRLKKANGRYMDIVNYNEAEALLDDLKEAVENFKVKNAKVIEQEKQERLKLNLKRKAEIVAKRKATIAAKKAGIV